MEVNGDSELDPSWRDNIYTIPNVISIARLGAVPIFVWLLLGEERRLSAALLLGILGATDWVDGWIAVAVFSMLIDGSVPSRFGVLTLVRESIVAIAALILAGLGARAIEVTWLGKTSSFGLMFVYPFFLISAGTVGIHSEVWEVIAYCIGGPSLLLHYYAAFGYFPLARNALKEHRESLQ